MGLVANAWHHSATRDVDTWTSGTDQRWTIECHSVLAAREHPKGRLFLIRFDGVYMDERADFGDALDRASGLMRERANLQ